MKRVTRKSLLQTGAVAGAGIAAASTLRPAKAFSILKAPTAHLTAWWGGLAVAQEPAVNALVDRFHAKFPNIKISSTFFPTWDEMRQKTVTAMAAGTPPDVFRISVFDVGMFASRNGLLQLDSYVKNDPLYAEKEFLPATWQNVVYGGKLYALPWNYSAVTLLYAPDLFAKAGIKQPPTTWDELASYAAKLTDAKAKQYGFLIPANNSADNMNFFGPILFSYGVHLFNSDDPAKATKAAFDSKAGVDALQLVVDLAKSHHALVNPAASVNDQLTGRIGMWLDGQWAIRTYASEAPNLRYKAALLPASPFSRGTTVAGGNQIGVAAATKYPAEAVEFIKFVQSPAEDVLFANTGSYLPARIANLTAPYLRTYPWNVFVEQGKYARNRTAVTNANHILSDIMQEVAAAELGQVSAAQALQTAAGEANSLL